MPRPMKRGPMTGAVVIAPPPEEVVHREPGEKKQLRWASELVHICPYRQARLTSLLCSKPGKEVPILHAFAETASAPSRARTLTFPPAPRPNRKTRPPPALRKRQRAASGPPTASSSTPQRSSQSRRKTSTLRWPPATPPASEARAALRTPRTLFAIRPPPRCPRAATQAELRALRRASLLVLCVLPSPRAQPRWRTPAAAACPSAPQSASC